TITGVMIVIKTDHIAHDANLLAAVLHGANPYAAEHVTASSFYVERDQAIWAAMLELQNQGVEISPSTVANRLGQSADRNHLDELNARQVDPARVSEYAARVAENTTKRLIQKVGHDIYHAADSDQPTDEV